jgi:hypothetical protein
MTPATIPRSRSKPQARWVVPAALIFLSLVPVIAGAVRLTDLTGGEITPESSFDWSLAQPWWRALS